MTRICQTCLGNGIVERFHANGESSWHTCSNCDGRIFMKDELMTIETVFQNDEQTCGMFLQPFESEDDCETCCKVLTKALGWPKLKLAARKLAAVYFITFENCDSPWEIEPLIVTYVTCRSIFSRCMIDNESIAEATENVFDDN